MSTNKDWVILVYAATDDTLPNFSVDSLKQMKSSAAKAINTIDDFDAGRINPSKRYVFDGEKPFEHSNGPDLQRTFGPINTRGPNNLAAFIEWSADHLPDEHYVVIWGHGAGVDHWPEAPYSFVSRNSVLTLFKGEPPMDENNQPVLDRESQAFLKWVKESGRPEMHTLSVSEARALFAKGQAAVPVIKPPAEVETRTIPLGPTGNLEIRIVRPVGGNSGLPVVMYFHGGGWVLGNFETHERVVRDIVNGANVVAVFPEYTCAPDAPYPVANEQAYAATKWVAEHGKEIGADAERLAVAGESAGGNMATVVAMLAQARGGPKIAAQVLFYPSTGGRPDLPSKVQFAEGYYLTAETGKWFWQNYSGGVPIHTEPTACPLCATIEQLKGLPPALIITAECDVLRDEGEAYARKLSQAGVEVTCTRYLGTLHGFNVANALAGSAASRASIAQACAMLREHLAISSQHSARTGS